MLIAGGVEMVVRTFTAVIHKEDDLYVAECPEVGTVSQGYTIEEAIANLKEATELYLEDSPWYATRYSTAGKSYTRRVHREFIATD
jgi:predicted RNase H-like HicB family nuclease